MSEKLTVEFCVIESIDPFIFRVNGGCTVQDLIDIEKELSGHLDDYDVKDDGEYQFSCSDFRGQYGDYGMCEIAPGWELTLEKFTPLLIGD